MRTLKPLYVARRCAGHGEFWRNERTGRAGQNLVMLTETYVFVKSAGFPRKRIQTRTRIVPLFLLFLLSR